MHRQLEDLFDILGRKLVDDVVSDVNQRGAAMNAFSAGETDEEDGLWLVSRFDYVHDEYVFSDAGKEYQEKHITFLASLTLPFQQKLFETDIDNRRRLMFKYQYYGEDYLGKILEETNIMDGVFGAENNQLLHNEPLEFQGDELNYRNLAFLWASYMKPSPYYCLPCNFNLRNCGYVFWDADRLNRSGLTKDPRPYVMPPCLSFEKRSQQ